MQLNFQLQLVNEQKLCITNSSLIRLFYNIMGYERCWENEHEYSLDEVFEKGGGSVTNGYS